MKLRFLTLLVTVLAAGCAAEDAKLPLYISALDYDFKESSHGWEAAFAEYPATREDSLSFELRAAYTDDVTASLLTRRSLMLSGNNLNGDLFMYAKRKVTGLLPNTDYTVTFSIDFASQVDAAAATKGSVFLKAGSSHIEPKSVIEQGQYRLNIDKGNHGEPGEDMVILGDILAESQSNTYVLLNRNNTMANSRYIARTSSRGEMWLIVGTDSSWKGSTTIFLKRIQVVLSAS